MAVLRSFLGLTVACAFVAIITARNIEKRQASFPPEGTPGVDYPTFNAVPSGLTFGCNDKLPGYYADPAAQCQVWHWCLPNGQKYSFLCPNGTMFNQNYRVCDWWYNVQCNESPNLYSINADLYKDANGNPI